MRFSKNKLKKLRKKRAKRAKFTENTKHLEAHQLAVSLRPRGRIFV